jgi:hypothetical protein
LKHDPADAKASAGFFCPQVERKKAQEKLLRLLVCEKSV